MTLLFFQALRGASETDPTSLFTGLFLGLMSIMAFYNLFLFFSLKDRAYLIYVGIVVCNIGNIISLNGVGAQYIWEGGELRNDWLYVVFGSISFALSIWFANVFLKVKETLPKFYRWHSILIGLSLVLLVLALFRLKAFYDPFGRLISLFIFPTLITVGTVSYKKGLKSAIYYTIAWIPYSLGILTAIFMKLEVIPVLTIFEYSLEIGGGLEILLLSLALANRIKAMREEIAQKELEKEQLKTSLLEEQKVVLEKTVDERTKELQEANATKDKFFSIIAHDLRSPIIGLQGMGMKMEHFLKKNNWEKLHEITGQIDYSIEKLNHLLNNLLNWATQEMGEIPYRPEKVQLKSIILENVGLFKSYAKSKKIKISHELDEVSAELDINSVSTVIRNLISNAIKFTPEQGIVTIKLNELNDQVEILIADQGKGMSEEVEDKLKSSVNSISEVGTSGEKGFGLGLKLSNEFVRLNKGSMIIQSTPESGTEIYVRFPLES